MRLMALIPRGAVCASWLSYLRVYIGWYIAHQGIPGVYKGVYMPSGYPRGVYEGISLTWVSLGEYISHLGIPRMGMYTGHAPKVGMYTGHAPNVGISHRGIPKVGISHRGIPKVGNTLGYAPKVGNTLGYAPKVGSSHCWVYLRWVVLTVGYTSGG